MTNKPSQPRETPAAMREAVGEWPGQVLDRRFECRRYLTRYRESEDGRVKRCALCGSPVDLMIAKP